MRHRLIRAALAALCVLIAPFALKERENICESKRGGLHESWLAMLGS